MTWPQAVVMSVAIICATFLIIFFMGILTGMFEEDK